MTKNPSEADDTPEPEGGRAAERLNDLMLGRFPAATTETDDDPAADADVTPENTEHKFPEE